MSRQARRQTYKRHTGSRNPSLAFVWLSIGIFLGIGGMGMAYLFFRQHPPQIQTTAAFETASSKQKPQKAKLTEKSTYQASQRFEFYNLLPGMEVEIAEKPNKEKASPTVQASKEKPKQNPKYLVQAGIFQDLAAADALKARLALQGFSAHIQKVQTQEGFTWFRVTLGPFASESLALNQKKQLSSQKISGILILQRSHE